MQPLEIGFCSWSIDRNDVIAAIGVAGKELDLRAVQIGFFGQKPVRRADVEGIRAAASEADIEISGTFVGFDGENYSSIASIRRTGGFAPEGQFEGRLELTRKTAVLASSLGLDKLAVHLGAVPDDPSEPHYGVLLERARRAADVVASYGITLLAETGQEPAETLRRFLNELDRENVAANFDSGNFITYGTGDPVEAVTILGDCIQHVHIKDSVASGNPGVDWGREASLGTGDARIPRVISRLRTRGYDGPLTIERKYRGDDRRPAREDINYLRSMLA